METQRPEETSILEGKLREDEREFLIEYWELEKLDREKEIKFF